MWIGTRSSEQPRIETRDRRSPVALLAALAASALLMLAGPAGAAVCIVPAGGGGDPDLPPAGPDCTTGYVSASDLHEILDGLMPGDTIEIGVEHARFFNTSSTPGGPLGGATETFDSELILSMEGTGTLAAFSRVITIPNVSVITATGPRSPGDRVQTFPNEMVQLDGLLPGTDPDFQLLRVTAGTAHGFPSSGQTTLAERSDGDWVVDSFFDIAYEIEFVGAPGGALAGLSGTTQATANLRQGSEYIAPLPCLVDEPPGGPPLVLPPDCKSGQGYVSPTDLHMIIAGLPPGTEIEIKPEHRGFFNLQSLPGGPLGGAVETFDSEVELQMTGTGSLNTFSRTIVMPLQAQTATAPNGTGAPQESFPTEMVQLQGQLVGDPDFDQLTIQAGPPNGLNPSPGETTLTALGGGEWNVDSFFDIEYRISFVGAAGSALDGLSGSTTSTLRMEAGVPVAAPAQVPALGLFGLALLAGSLAVGAARYRRRRRSA